MYNHVVSRAVAAGRRQSLLLALGVAIFSGELQAQVHSLVVPNGSFEEPVNDDVLYRYRWTNENGNSWMIPSWTYNIHGGGIGAGGTQNSINAEFPGTTGSPGNLEAPGLGPQYGWLNSHGEGDVNTSFTSVAIAQIQPLTRYRLTVAVGDRLDEEPAEVAISLLANGSLIPGAQAWTTGAQLPEGSFVDVSTMFDVLGPGDPLIGQLLHVRLLHHKPSAAGLGIFQANFDNVRLAAEPIPEPASALSVALGVFACVMMRRSRSLVCFRGHFGDRGNV